MGYKHKRTATAGKVPVAANFADGEILVNTADGRAFVRGGSGVKTLPNTDDVAAAAAAAAANKLPNNGGSFSGGYPGPDPVALTGTNLSPTIGTGHERSYTNSGAFTLNAPAGGDSGTICIAVTNGAASGALNALGFHKVHGTFSPTPNKKQLLVIEVHGAGWKTLSIRDDT